MSRIRIGVGAYLLLVACVLSAFAQQSGPSLSIAQVPTLVNFSGVLTDVNGKPLSGIVGVTFYLYKDQQGGAPLWIETQNVQFDKSGHYSVMLGSTTGQGLPANLFVSGEARWLGVQAQGEAEQPRVMLSSVPYALKAGDAATVGGLPPSAFVLAAPGSGTAANGPNGGTTVSSPPSGSSDVTTTGGTVNDIPLWTTSTNIQSSAITQSGTGKTAKIGINNSKPASTLDVKGASILRGLLSLPATGTATASAGFNSQPIQVTASAYNSGTGTAVSQNFQW
jgi:hypothetical protein